MRFYPNGDPYCFVELPSSWQHYCREPHKSWKPSKMQKVHAINYYRDFEGAKKDEITNQDLQFDAYNSRIRPEACLPLYYGLGARLILLEQAPPVGYKCAPLPMNLEEVRHVNKQEEEYKKDQANDAKEEEEEETKKKIKKKSK